MTLPTMEDVFPMRFVARGYKWKTNIQEKTSFYFSSVCEDTTILNGIWKFSQEQWYKTIF
jgi:hypothetical protein